MIARENIETVGKPSKSREPSSKDEDPSHVASQEKTIKTHASTAQEKKKTEELQVDQVPLTSQVSFHNKSLEVRTTPFQQLPLGQMSDERERENESRRNISRSDSI